MIKHSNEANVAPARHEGDERPTALARSPRLSNSNGTDISKFGHLAARLLLDTTLPERSGTLRTPM